MWFFGTSKKKKSIATRSRSSRRWCVEIPAHNSARSFKPRVGDVERLVDVTNNARVIGDKGKSYSLTYVKPVPIDSTSAEPQAVTGSAQHSDRARRELQAFANRVQAQFAGTTQTLHAVAAFLRGIRSFTDATRRARIRQRRRVAAFLRICPELFTVESTLGRGSVSVNA